MPEFKKWEKIPRDNPFSVTITEKIDGTNACVIIEDGVITGVQSRKRLITPDDDNYDFAKWVELNKDELLQMGDGYHYGEWAGPGIQKNPLKLDRRKFFLFDVRRWNSNNPNIPPCCDVVPVLFNGELKPGQVDDLLQEMELTGREGVVVYYHAFRSRTKHTVKYHRGKWNKE